MQVPVYNLAGEAVRTMELSDVVFGQPYNEGLIHQAMVRYMANQRQGTASTLRRGEVAGGGRKPWRQKGTGRARQGSTRAPHWRGGGVVFGPHPRDYRQEMPLKMRRAALRSALSARVGENALRVIEGFNIEEPRTREIVGLLDRLGIAGKALLVTPEIDRNVYMSTRNIPGAAASNVDQLNISEVVGYQYLVVPVATVERLEAKLGEPVQG